MAKITLGTIIAGRKIKGKYSMARLGISDMDTSQKQGVVLTPLNKILMMSIRPAKFHKMAPIFCLCFPIRKMAKSIVAAKDLSKGHIIKYRDLAFKSPGGGLKPYEYNDVLYKKLKKDIKKDEIVNKYFLSK